LKRVQDRTAPWTPQSKKQWLAFLSEADELFFGGAAGGGKSDLIIGLAISSHQHSAIFRRTYPNLTEIMRRARQIIGDLAKENKSEKIWTFPDGRTLEFGAVQYEDDKSNWQGRPHDLKAFDELPEFSESQYEFICGWNRSVDSGQRVRVVSTGNPPMDESGSWIIRRWAAWLDPDHPRPAKDGELRYYATIDGKETECESKDPFEHNGETIYPRSRTFIKSLLSDNPFYAHDSHYISVLQSLPEPMRSQLLHGDFAASQMPNPWQVIPSEWVRLAQRRWVEREKPETPITAVGIDPSRGGHDKTAMSERYDNYFDELHTWPGYEAVDGPTVAGLAQHVLQEKQPGYINVDVVGIGSSVFDSLKVMYEDVCAFNGAEGSEYRDRSGKLKMRNRRAEAYWQMRDALDPELGDDLALPPGNELLADLCAARYEVTASGVLIEEKEKIKERIGRSPDMGEAVMMSNFYDKNRGPSLSAWTAAIKKRNEARKQGAK
jgi:hypothetical protein